MKWKKTEDPIYGENKTMKKTLGLMLFAAAAACAAPITGTATAEWNGYQPFNLTASGEDASLRIRAPYGSFRGFDTRGNPLEPGESLRLDGTLSDFTFSGMGIDLTLNGTRYLGHLFLSRQREMRINAAPVLFTGETTTVSQPFTIDWRFGIYEQGRDRVVVDHIHLLASGTAYGNLRQYNDGTERYLLEDIRYDITSGSVANIPEPGTVALVGAGIAFLVFRRRRAAAILPLLLAGTGSRRCRA